ncbi:unnamed protein product [Macrosiphum euphorbiae]|uniref:Microtubule-associated protein futsch n=1 Tax=Macrosiphum euphorbiae TaxID=13131 RepID=A0AAV0W2J3_9HEMI|nr:unnamed protein product [Macrosiphum euphorbiae]
MYTCCSVGGRTRLSCWNYEESGVDIVTEFNAIVNQNIEGEEGKNGEQLFQYASDNLVAEILINPQHSTLVQCVRNLLASFTKYRCIIHAGYSFTENGSWILQDGSFSVTDFLDAYKTAEAQRTIRLHENQIRIELHCSADADWNQVSRVKGTRFLLNPPEKIIDIESIESIVRWLCDKIEVAELDILLEGSQVVGNIRFSRPTLYVFPAGQGDSALFGINGFNMLIDGGAGRNSCFWGFARHLDRLDAVLLTRLNSSNLEGVASFLKRKTMSSLYPQIGHFFCNFKTRKQISSPNIDAKQDVLSISLIDTAQSIITDLKQLQLRPHLCYRNINLEPINLYHKVGHGKLDMYVLNPSKDSKEVKDFLTKWNEGDQKLFNPTKDLQFPLPNIISVCTLLVWQPANPNTTITRILFPGSSPQNKIFESLERVRHLDFLKHPSCSIKSMSSSTSVTVKSQTTKKTVLEKMIPGETKTVKTMENLEVSTSASNAVIQTAIIPTVPKEGTPKPKFPVETEKPKQSIKLVMKETANAKPKIEHKYSSISARVNSNKIAQKSSTTKKSLKLSSKSPPTDKSSPTTPIENQEKAPKPIKQVIKPKSTSTTTKSPSSTPTKSKKEEANRKVLVSSRTNSGLKRTPITKKETKPANPKITETSLKKDSNIVYKSSLISCNKDKSGEEEDILIVEKVAITPEKLLTPDGKKIIANELDGILTTAKDIVTKEKLSDSGATTAPTMPEDEKINESKKEIEVNESDKKVEEFKKAKDALKTPDEVADLPFHEEADEQKPKVAEKEIESEIETQEIVQVENAEYVLVSLDSSPEVLKRQVLDTVGLLDTELDEDSDKEDEYVETKQSTILPDIDEKTKLIEHLLESSKDLCEITEKIDELKKQNEHEITNHQIHDHLQDFNHDHTKTSNCTQLNKQENSTQIQEEAKIELQEKECIDEKRLTIDNENDKDIHGSSHVEECNAENGDNTQDLKQITTTQGPDTDLVNVANITMDKKDSKASSKAGSICDEPLTLTRSRSGSKTEEPERNTENSTDKQRSKASSKAGSICDEPLKSPGPDISTDKIRSSSICQEQDKTNNVEEKQESKASSKAGSVCDEPVKSPIHETNTSANVVPSRSGSITEEPENTNVTDMQRSKTSSTAGSICDETLKSPGPDISTDKIRSSSICQEQDKTNNAEAKQESKASSKAGSVCDEPVKSPVHETNTSANVVPSRSGSITEEPENTNVTDMQRSKTSSTAGSICDETLKSPGPDISTDKIRSSSICQEQDKTNNAEEKQESKASSKAGSVCDEPVKSPVHETNTSANVVPSRSGSITEEPENTNVTDMQKSKASSKGSSICDELVRSPVHETITTAKCVSSRSGSITKELEITEEITINKQGSKASSKVHSVVEELTISPGPEINTDKTETTDLTSLVSQALDVANVSDTDKQESKASSKASSVCDEPIKSPIHETITSANAVSSRSGSITEEQENIQKNVTDMQRSKASSKARSVCEEPIKSPVHEIVNAITSITSSITHDPENTTKNTTGSKPSSKASSVCDEPVKSPVHETITSKNSVPCRSSSICDEPVKSPIQEIITSVNAVPSRSGSITEEPEKVPDLQKSKSSSKSSSICDETIKSPVHEIVNAITCSRSNSLTHELENATNDVTGSKASSKAGSVCDEPIKSPIHETITSANVIPSRSGSMTEPENAPENVSDLQKSKTSSKGSSICDETVKSPVHEIVNAITSRSNSLTHELENATNDVTGSKASSKASSVCEKPIKSPVHEIVNAITSITSSLTHDPENTTKNATGSKASSKASSVCDEPIKSPINETITSANAVPSRSGSITEEQENTTENVTDIQRSKASSKASSVCEEPIKSPVHEIVNAITSITSSITHDPENTTKNVTGSKASSKASSVCDEPVKSPVHETITSEISVSCRSGSITEEPENITDVQRSKASSKASSICDEPVKSPVHETIAKGNAVISMPLSDSITDKSESILHNVTDMQISKVSSKPSSICDEPVKSPVHETITSENSVSFRSGSLTEEPENVTDIQRSKTSSKASSICDEPVKSPVHETIAIANALISMPLSESVTEKPESIPDNVTNIQKCNVSTTASSVCDKPVKHPSHEIVNEINNISSTLTHEIENTTKNATGSKASSKASSVCDEPIKSPIHETITSANAVSSRSGSITEEPENTPENVPDIQKSKTSSKASSICDEPVKSPVDETIASANSIRSRSGSVTEKPDSIPDNVTDIQRSKASSKASSICDEPVKSPVHEIVNVITSISSTLTHEIENTTKNATSSKASSRASSVCEEPVKSPVHELITSPNAIVSRSSSITDKLEIVPDNVTDIQKSKTSSKASSICDEPATSSVDETIASANSVINRSGSVTEKPESILDHVTNMQRSGSITEEQENTPENVTDMQKSKSSSKANSVCDEPVKSPIHETITSVNAVPSRSGSITENPENTPEHVPDIQKSKTSSKASSVCDEPVKSPVHEIVNVITRISSTLTHEIENTTKNATGSKASSRASSVCEEPVKSPVHELITSPNAIVSRSSSITDKLEIVPDNVTDMQKSKTCSKASSICDESVKSPVYETVNAITSISSSVTHEPENTTKNGIDSKASSRASSVCDEPVKSPVRETTTLINSITSSSNTISQESKNIPENEIEKQGSKASSKSGSVCDELVKSPLCENKKSENTITNLSSSITQEPEIDSHCSKASSKANSIGEEPLKSSELAIISTNGSESKSRSSSVNLEQDITHVSINDKQESEKSSVVQETEFPQIIGMDKHDVESCSRKDSFFQDKNNSSTFSSSSTSSICQEIDTQSSKLSSRKSSVVDESISNPSKLHIGEKSSSLQESNVYEHNIDNNTKTFNKSGSLCDEMLNLPFNKVTENIISNEAYEKVVSPETTVGNTESKMVNAIESMCEESIKSDNDEICTKEHLVSSTSSLILHETEEEKCQLPRKSSVLEEPQNSLTEDNNTILSPSDCNKSNIIERRAEESKSFGRIGSLCEEIAKFLTDNDNKISTNITSESPCSLIESIPLKSNIDELKVETETLLQLNKNTDTLNKIEKSLQLDDKVKVDEKHDNINEKNTDHSLPVKNITESNNKPPNISTLLIEENNKTGIMNVAQMVGKNILDESLTKHTVITDNESKSLKTFTPIANVTSEECISKLSNVLIEDIVKTSDDKNIICDSSITDICMNQPLGVTLNSEDLGVTKDIVMQLKRDVHEALHQCSSDDERPFTPQSESSMSRSAMNIDEDDDDNEDNKIETDDDMPGSPMSTRPSPVQMQLDNRHVEINMDFNKALQEHRITRGEDLTATEANGNHVTEIKTTEHDNINQNQGTSSDTVQSWGKPLGLPPVQSINNNGFDPIREWGKPLGLPSPTQPILELTEPQNMSGKTTPKKNVKKIIDNKPIINVMDKDAQNRIRRSESPSKLRSRSSSRMSRINPIYLDLIYVPHHGNSKYVSADFFKRVRARNYVFSGTDPSKEVLNALIEGKQAWEDQDLEVTIIPTYDTDTLGQWVAENEELLTKLKIDLSPSASRCTIKLQDHNTSCSAYRLEF